MPTNLNLKFLKDVLPPIIARSEVPKLLGGVLSIGYLANMDSAGKGPVRMYIGRKVVYTRESLIEFLEKRCSDKYLHQKPCETR